MTLRRDNRIAHRDWHNAPVAGIGDPHARLLVVGLAPGLKGANRTGIPFHGDDSGVWLWETLREHGLAAGEGLELKDVAVTNAVKCVPPGNKPVAAEIRNCREHLRAELAAFPRLRVIVVLGRIAHDSVLRVLGAAPKERAFAHGRVHRLEAGAPLVVDCFHPSPLNTRTGRMSRASWRRVWAKAVRLLDETWFVYILRCADGSLYTGVTTDPRRRLAQHASGKGAAYTRGKGAQRIVHLEEAASKSEAHKREAAIKALDRRQKLELIPTNSAGKSAERAGKPVR